MTVVWIGGEHEFALKIGQLRALQKACDAGPEQILARIWSGQWRIDDLFEIIRLGLIGGGEVAPTEAGIFVTSLFEKHPVMRFKDVASHVLMVALLGDEGDSLGEALGETTPQKSGDSVKSTVAEQS